MFVQADNLAVHSNLVLQDRNFSQLSDRATSKLDFNESLVSKTKVRYDISFSISNKAKNNSTTTKGPVLTLLGNTSTCFHFEIHKLLHLVNLQAPHQCDQPIHKRVES